MKLPISTHPGGPPFFLNFKPGLIGRAVNADGGCEVYLKWIAEIASDLIPINNKKAKRHSDSCKMIVNVSPDRRRLDCSRHISSPDLRNDADESCRNGAQSNE
jgi:hypothetical protein